MIIKPMPSVTIKPTPSVIIKPMPTVNIKPSRMPAIYSLPLMSSSNMRDELQRVRYQKLKECFKLDEIVTSASCEPMPMWYFIDVACTTSVSERTPEFDTGPLKCEMPLKTGPATCDSCVNLGPYVNCNLHMPTCDANNIFLGCNNCSRLLCGKHIACHCRNSNAATYIVVKYLAGSVH